MSYIEELDLDGRKFSLETGRLAKQADGSILASIGDTMVLVTAVGASKAPEGLDFFPLSVDYREKAYAAGKIPGGYFKREARPSETEILSARLVDRSIRPLFDEGYKNEVQVMISVLSSDKENLPDALAITATSSALYISDIPFNNPIAGVRVGLIDGEFVANPTHSALEASELDLIVAGSEDSIVMVEGEANEISEQRMLDALEFGHAIIKQLVGLQKNLREKAGKEKRVFTPDIVPAELVAGIKDKLLPKLPDAFSLTDKKERKAALKEVAAEIVNPIIESDPEAEKLAYTIIHDIEKDFVRKQIVKEGKRIDGRGLEDIRDISCEVSVLPRTHGSALFTRGQTQALATTTLGTKLDEQRMDNLEGEYWKSYMLHYNFPPFCVGEIKPNRGTSRREIGHGNLAERSLKPSMPSQDVFPYTVRVVSEILESNGSSSMASVCAGTLALMDAGVPLKTPIAGIAMGLIREGDQHVVLTDILGDEDHLGDMDFKVAGSEKGITAFQMDIKIDGLPREVFVTALAQAQSARLKILDIMNKALDTPRTEMSRYAPRIDSIKIKPDNIGTVIGPGGKMIREITEKSGATINIDDDGTVIIASAEPESMEKAKEMIRILVQEPEKGKTYQGKVKKIMNFGAFVEILPGKEGLLHISQIAHDRINKVEDVLSVGDEVEVKLLDVDPQGKMDLSRKVLLPRED